jgi:hypothetical protein
MILKERKKTKTSLDVDQGPSEQRNCNLGR